MYHEARAQARKVKEAQEDNKRRAERRAELANVQAEHPLNVLSVDGRPCKLYRNQEQYHAAETMEGLIALNGNSEDMIDRFDGRVLLDFVGRELEPHDKERPKSSDEQRLEELLAFERYRDVAHLQSLGLSDHQGLSLAISEGIEIRAAQRAAAAAALAAATASGQASGSGRAAAAAAAAAAAIPAGQGMFGAVGFSYGGAGSVDTGSIPSSSDSDSEGDGEDASDGTNQQQDEAELEAEEERLDGIARTYGVGDFSYRLHKANKQEGETLAMMLRPVRSRLSRKKSNQRARRMHGQGLDAPRYVPRGSVAGGVGGDAQHQGRDVWPAPAGGPSTPWGRRSSPEHYSRKRSPSRSRSRSPRRGREERPRTEFITEFSAKAGPGASSGSNTIAAHTADLWRQPKAAAPAFDRNAFTRDEGGILEAMPDRPDPASLGAQAFPLDKASMQGIKPHEWRRNEREKEREREHAQDIDRDRRRGSYNDYRQDREHSYSTSERDGGSRASVSGRTALATLGSTASAAAPPKETPQERLKRIMQAQLNKQVQKDNLVATQKKVQVEKEKAARVALDRAAQPRRSPSPRRGRSRSRSRSPDRHRSRYRRSHSR